MSVAPLRTALGVVSLGLFATLVWYGQTTLSPDGLRSFDARPFGYDLTAAREYLGALSETGRVDYLGPVRSLDTAFPLCFSAFMALLFLRVTRDWSLAPRILLLLLPGAYLVMDLAENALVARLLAMPIQDLRAGDVNLASAFTMTKYVTFSGAVAALLALGVVRR